jgi:outer membrane lipoprotein-sorting protein
MPYHTVTKQGGKVGADVTVTDVKVNPGISEALFKKPPAQ